MKQKRPLSQVKPIADKLLEKLSPYCERIEFAGSIRRKKQMVGDIEIIAIPKYDFQNDLFGNNTSKMMRLNSYLREIGVRLIKNGDRYKQFTFETKRGYTYQVDLFLQDEETWGINYMIRTGSADFSRKMVTAISRGGYVPDDLRVAGARLWRGDEPLETRTELSLFEAYGMKFIEPENRA